MCWNSVVVQRVTQYINSVSSTSTFESGRCAEWKKKTDEKKEKKRFLCYFSDRKREQCLCVPTAPSPHARCTVSTPLGEYKFHTTIIIIIKILNKTFLNGSIFFRRTRDSYLDIGNMRCTRGKKTRKIYSISTNKSLGVSWKIRYTKFGNVIAIVVSLRPLNDRTLWRTRSGKKEVKHRVWTCFSWTIDLAAFFGVFLTYDILSLCLSNERADFCNNNVAFSQALCGISRRESRHRFPRRTHVVSRGVPFPIFAAREFRTIHRVTCSPYIDAILYFVDNYCAVITTIVCRVRRLCTRLPLRTARAQRCY